MASIQIRRLVKVYNQQKALGEYCPLRKSLLRWLHTAVITVGVPRAVGLNFYSLSSEEMQRLNERHRQIKKPTNVLAFPWDSAGERAGRRLFLGEIFCCPFVIKKEAEETGQSCTEHWAHITVHGFLHLLGYDHQTDAQAQEMEGLECLILNRLGMQNPY